MDGEKEQIFYRLLQKCEKRIDILRRVRKMGNELLCNCAYHEKNMEEQLHKMAKAGASKKEIEDQARSYNVRNKYAKDTVKDYNDMLEMMDASNEKPKPITYSAFEELNGPKEE